MKRRGMRAAAVTALALLGGSALGLGPVAAQAKPVTLQLYTQLSGPAAGTNLNIYTNVLVPMFEKTHPDIKVHVTFGGTEDAATLGNIIASIESGEPSPYDIVDPNDIMIPLWDLHDGVVLTDKNIPLLKEVNPVWMQQSLQQAVPFRGSWVVLAYNSKYVKNPPTTLAGLIKWIKANPGKFDYCNPSTGGSGQAFVQTVLDSFIPQSVQTTMQNSFKPSSALENEYWAKGFAELKSIAPDLYRHGYYANGNLPIDQLLASGTIWMAPQWSDIATSSLRVHALPPWIKLSQPSPPFQGGPADVLIPKNSAHIKQAEIFVNWLLTPAAQDAVVTIMGGFPGVEYKYMSPAVRQKFDGILATPGNWYSTQYGDDMAKDWQTEVAAQ
jgi:putative spermidine/putrescine transport system substrate-binding protein